MHSLALFHCSSLRFLGQYSLRFLGQYSLRLLCAATLPLAL